MRGRKTSLTNVFFSVHLNKHCVLLDVKEFIVKGLLVVFCTTDLFPQCPHVSTCSDAISWRLRDYVNDMYVKLKTTESDYQPTPLLLSRRPSLLVFWQHVERMMRQKSSTLSCTQNDCRSSRASFKVWVFLWRDKEYHLSYYFRV